jgi:hypothetical protein
MPYQDEHVMLYPQIITATVDFLGNWISGTLDKASASFSTYPPRHVITLFPTVLGQYVAHVYARTRTQEESVYARTQEMPVWVYARTQTSYLRNRFYLTHILNNNNNVPCIALVL